MKSLIYSFMLLSASVLMSCGADDARSLPSTHQNPELLDVSNKAKSSAKTVSITLKKVTKSVINEASLLTLKTKRPQLYSQLKVQGLALKATEKYTLYEGGHLTVLLGNHDLYEDTPEETTINVSGYEKVPIDIIGNLILWAVCECNEGSDDCKFDRNEDGSLGECMGGGACTDCRGGFELSGPDNSIAQVEASF